MQERRNKVCFHHMFITFTPFAYFQILNRIFYIQMTLDKNINCKTLYFAVHYKKLYNFHLQCNISVTFKNKNNISLNCTIKSINERLEAQGR